ncbi:hypothetical protein PMZ80_006887 [Knufia obscura]|uniref:Uncharacterized protein n=2 Tax=Knufia TaxID=430999 RepID=A0AAN8EK12_9EURO|nr:hypothetical protein PMZ80_006887 [Knufia obscura]KAK5957429.1 hypothetical protein OHC33_001803 [Knufia fluminis]
MDVPDSDEDLVLEINELSSQQHSRTLFGRHKWNITHAIVLLAQLAVLAVYAQRLVADRNATVEVVFGRDFHYMTLDKEYDHLWDGPEIQEAGVIVLDEHSSTYNDVDQGAISMYTLFPVVSGQVSN